MKNFNKNNLFQVVIISMTVIIIFSFGYFISNLIKFEKPVIIVEKIDNDINYNQKIQNMQASVVASVNSDKYHYMECAGAKRIKEKNKIYFQNAQEAQGAGFTLANNCTK